MDRQGNGLVGVGITASHGHDFPLAKIAGTRLACAGLQQALPSPKKLAGLYFVSAMIDQELWQ